MGTTSVPKHQIVPVATPSRAYDVHVGQALLPHVGELVQAACGGEVAAVISDSNVAPLYAQTVLDSLQNAGYRTALITFAAGEQHKRFATLEPILEQLAAVELSREDVVVALGGGVTGDMAGLAAAMYLRGCKVAQVPTSLLAMVDSSVGGKTAVDLEAGKNLAGAFFQPSVVVADIDCLGTLSHQLFTDSCGEVIKHGMIRDAQLFKRLAATPLNTPGFSRADLVDIVAQNVRIKRDVVNADETERGLRQILNFGHTLGHAVEAASDFTLGHGSCVAIGMCCITRAAAAQKWCSYELTHELEKTVAAFGLPTDTTFDHQTIFHFATHDKKRHGSTVNLVVPSELGRVSIKKVTLAELQQVIELGCGTQDTTH